VQTHIAESNCVQALHSSVTAQSQVSTHARNSRGDVGLPRQSAHFDVHFHTDFNDANTLISESDAAISNGLTECFFSTWLLCQEKSDAISQLYESQVGRVEADAKQIQIFAVSAPFRFYLADRGSRERAISL